MCSIGAGSYEIAPHEQDTPKWAHVMIRADEHCLFIYFSWNLEVSDFQTDFTLHCTSLVALIIMTFWNAFLALLLVLPVAVFSFQIDASCTAKGVEGLVRDGMINAFSMVDSASRRLEKNPYDEETTKLIAHLFMPKIGQDPNDRDKLTKVRSIFTNIGKRFREETTGPPKNTDVVRADSYCVPGNGLKCYYILCIVSY